MSKQESSEDKLHLHVYKASAGSGKTHRLTEEYLTLLFDSPMAYRHILAVTFTNKATDEMKTRIITELARLAKGESSPYVATLSKKLKMNEKQLQKDARDTLVRILHDYSAFSVSTIDRFFQQTMRAFTREIGLGGGYNVELDTDGVLTEAIDSMLYDLERRDNKMLLDWLIRFSEEKVENGETWNIKNDIHSLSSEIFKEGYKAYSDKVQENIEDKELMTNYKDMLYKMIAIFDNQSKQIGTKGINIMDRYGLAPDDFKGGSRSPFFNFLKWANGEVAEPSKTFEKLADEVSGWYTAKTDSGTKAKIEEAFPELNNVVNDAIVHYANSRAYQTAKEINRYFFALGILGDVDKKVREYAAENNIMLISDTTELLTRIIDGSDTPFVYEKIGTHIDHYMIDEFQDTSGMQWENFRPLVKDSLAAGNDNYIVGDVKQSIYRWRNSDWKLLDSQLDIDFQSEGIDHETLDTNWRSGYNIVNFNNAIFTLGADLLQENYNKDLPEDLANANTQRYSSKIKDAYNDLFQHVPEKNKGNAGHVKVQFVDSEEHSSWQEYVLDQLPQQIEELQDRGYRLKDIAILVRTKKEGAEIANRLLQYKSQVVDSKYKYDIISDEALFISSAKSIRFIVSLLRYLRNPYDDSLKALAVYEYFKYNEQLSSKDALQKYFSDKEDLPSEVSARLNEIRQQALYEMVEALFELFSGAVEEDEQVYMQAFLDIVLDYTIRHSSDLDGFLRWWDEVGVNKTIFTPDGQDAIRIMTIHKSKGLGFEAVIIPFCDWAIDHRLTTILWCQPQIEPFDQLHLVPVRYGKKLSNTIFEDEYYKEKLHAYIDNINVLYVAFTRAKNDLIIFSPLTKRKDLSNISSLLWNCIDSGVTTEQVIDLSESFDEEELALELGKDYLKVQKEEVSEVEEILIQQLPSISFDDRLKLELSNKYFFTDTGLRDYGTLMHEVVSTITTVDDVEHAIEKYYISGDVTLEQRNELNVMLKKFLSRDLVADWYSGDYRVLNEVQILQSGGKFLRPDRVMIKGKEAIVIDYKFGEKEDKRYIRQVKTYMNLISKIGYQNVKGYICYVRLDKIIEL
mgnify:CR=1 FL=1